MCLKVWSTHCSGALLKKGKPDLARQIQNAKHAGIAKGKTKALDLSTAVPCQLFGKVCTSTKPTSANMDTDEVNFDSKGLLLLMGGQWCSDCYCHLVATMKATMSVLVTPPYNSGIILELFWIQIITHETFDFTSHFLTISVFKVYL